MARRTVLLIDAGAVRSLRQSRQHRQTNQRPEQEDLSGGYGNAGMRPERRLRGMSGRYPRFLNRLAEGGKSREREGSALAVKKPSSLRCRCGLGAPASRAALEHVAVMQQAIEHGADRGDIAEQLAPVLDRAI